MLFSNDTRSSDLQFQMMHYLLSVYIKLQRTRIIITSVQHQNETNLYCSCISTRACFGYKWVFLGVVSTLFSH